MILKSMDQFHDLFNQYIANNYETFEYDECFAALLNSYYDIKY